MSNLSKIVILVILVLTFFFVKEKFGGNISGFDVMKEVKKVELPQFPDKKESEVVKKSEMLPETDKKIITEKETVSLYFLALDSNSNGVYKIVQKEVPQGKDKFEFAIRELLKGPGVVEKSFGTYSEIPSETKLLRIKQTGNKIIIDFSSDFQYGGGTDSIYSRMMQLIKTSLANSKNKKIYLYLDGKQVNCIGGEGIMITQPLNENSLEV